MATGPNVGSLSLQDNEEAEIDKTTSEERRENPTAEEQGSREPSQEGNPTAEEQGSREPSQEEESASNTGKDPAIEQEHQGIKQEEWTVQIRPRRHSNPTIVVDGSTERSHVDEVGTADDEEQYQKKTKRLRLLLKLYFYSAAKYMNNKCSFHFIYFLFMIIQIAKLSCITAQMFNFGYERGNFNNVVRRGHMTLKTILLKDWDASWETPPYPPAHGDFAVYKIKALKEKINYAVENFYNAEEDAIGFYKRPEKIQMTALITYFDFGGFVDGDTFHGLSIKTKQFDLNVNNHTDPTTNDIKYTYNVDEDFKLNNLTEPIKRMLKITLSFTINSVRVNIDDKKARCLTVMGEITFLDPDNNGQVNVDLDTKTLRKRCSVLGYDVGDVTIETVSKSLMLVVLILSFISLVYTLACIAFGGFVFYQTKSYMNNYYLRFYEPERYKETIQATPTTSQSLDKDISGMPDLPWKEYARFIKGWDILVLAADLTTICGIIGLIDETNSNWTVESLDKFTVLLGIGCLFAWVALLRYFKFNYKFHLLFNTMYASAWDVLAYLACICVLFVGYMSFGYVVLGPYHIKFETPSSTAETLFSIVNGDEIYATFALLDEKQTGGDLVPIIHGIYLGSFIAIFTIVVLNLLIALFTNAYDAVKKQYEETTDDQDDGPVEAALKKLLIADDNDDKRVRDSVMHLLESDTHSLSTSEANLRTELQRIVAISKTKRNFILQRPKTIKAFILAEQEEESSDEKKLREHNSCCIFSCLFGCCNGEEKQVFV